MNANWETFEDPIEAAEACARKIAALLEQATAEREFATLALSGGSSPRPLFAKLAAMPLPWNRIHVFWVDERSVPPDDPASNYKLADDLLLRPAHVPPGCVHRIIGEMAPPRAADRYATEISIFFGLTSGALPRFDVVHRGIGPDCHTASLFPGEPLIDDRHGIAAAVIAPRFNQWRVTLLPGVLLAARHTVVLASGEDKAEAVRAVFQEEYDPKKYPAQLGMREGGDATCFLDRAAARLIDVA
jgi:6-phosphogluconolactonase